MLPKDVNLTAVGNEGLVGHNVKGHEDALSVEHLVVLAIDKGKAQRVARLKEVGGGSYVGEISGKERDNDAAS